MHIDFEGSIIELTRAEADAIRDPETATPAMLRDPARDAEGLGPWPSLLDRLDHRASELYYERGLTVCVTVVDGDDYEEIGIYNSRGWRWDAEAFAHLNADE
jgi:hypothetical protein